MAFFRLFRISHRYEGIPVYRRAEEIALIQEASDLFQRLLLFHGFDEFGEHLEIQGLRQEHNGVDDFFRAIVRQNRSDQIPVKLHKVKLIVLQVLQGGVAHAKIVQGKCVAEGSDFFDQLPGGFRRHQLGFLCYLDADIPLLQVIALSERLQEGDNPFIVERGHRDVDAQLEPVAKALP